MSQSERQADSIAAIALELPEQLTTSDVLRALVRAYKAGRQDTLAQMDKDLIRALADSHRIQAG